MVSVWLRRIAVTCAANGITAPWVKAAAWLRFATVMVVPGWWSYADSVVTYRNMSPIVPLWILLIFPPCASVYVARIIGYSSDALVFDRKWTAHDIRRLALWRTVSSTLPLWLFTFGVDGFRERNTVAVLWLVAGGLIALLAVARLHRVEGSGSATSNRVTFTNVHLYWQKEWAYRCVRSRSFHSAGGI